MGLGCGAPIGVPSRGGVRSSRSGERSRSHSVPFASARRTMPVLTVLIARLAQPS